MTKFLDLMNRFSSALVFNDYRRLSRPGFRWAPKSLLGARVSSLGPVGDKKFSTVKQIGTHRGLLVHYPGIICPVRFPAIYGLARSSTYTFCKENNETATAYRAVLPKGAELFRTDTAYVIVLSSIPMAGDQVPAMVGTEVEAGCGTSGVKIVEYRCNALVRALDHREEEPIGLPFSEADTQWLIT